MRSVASTSGAELTQVPLGAEITYLDEIQNGFFKVEYNGMTGYVLGSYTSVMQGDIGSGTSATVSNCDNYITLRLLPSTSADEITKISLGGQVSILSSAQNGFSLVSYNGRYGYCLTEYLK